jgi:hypothetical protein
MWDVECGMLNVGLGSWNLDLGIWTLEFPYSSLASKSSGSGLGLTRFETRMLIS